MNHLDLCSGIGGFALAAGWAGYTTIGFCEIDPWCRRVLAKHWPETPQHDDLKTLTAATVRGWIGAGINTGVLADPDSGRRTGRGWSGESAQRTSGDAASRGQGLDLITAGYPCQPFSLAGQRMGAEDDRHLWPFIAALVADLTPRRCLFENVFGHVSMGLDAVLSDLEAIGYACGAVVVPACAIGAPHRRDRVWILADAERSGRRESVRTDAAQGALSPALGTEGAPWIGSGGTDVADTESIGEREPADEANAVATGGDTWALTGGGSRNVSDADRAGCEEQRRSIANGAQHAAAQCDRGREALSSLGDKTDGLSGWLVGPDRLDPWARDWEAGMPRTTTREHDRTHKLKALGNAVVPQVAYEILRFWGQP